MTGAALNRFLDLLAARLLREPILPGEPDARLDALEAMAAAPAPSPASRPVAELVLSFHAWRAAARAGDVLTRAQAGLRLREELARILEIRAARAADD